MYQLFGIAGCGALGMLSRRVVPQADVANNANYSSSLVLLDYNCKKSPSQELELGNGPERAAVATRARSNKVVERLI
jgi:hypothetical protein